MKIKRSSFVYPYSVWMTAFIVLPMLFILYYAFTRDGEFSLEPIKTALQPENLQVLGISILYALATTVLCLLIGYTAAYLLSGMRKSVAAFLSVFFIVPMWMNFLLRTYAWKVILNAIAPHLIYTPFSVLLGMVYNFLPFMILPIYTVLSKMDKSFAEAAGDLGATPAYTFFKVTLPLSVPGIVSGITMVFVPSITAFAISSILGGGKNALYGDLIQLQFMSTANGWNTGSALSLVLLVFVLISMTVMRRVDKTQSGEGNRLW